MLTTSNDSVVCTVTSLRGGTQSAPKIRSVAADTLHRQSINRP